MSVQSQIDRLAAAKAAIKTAIEGKGVTVPDATALDGFAALIDAIGAGGGAEINIPDGCILTTGTFTPANSGKDVIHEIRIAQSLGAYPYASVYLFCIARAAGFEATSENTSYRNLVAYCGLSALPATNPGRAGGGVALYRNGTAFTPAGGVETSGTASYGIPQASFASRSNCLVRSIEPEGILIFSSYGLICLEASKEYRWFAIIAEGATA